MRVLLSAACLLRGRNGKGEEGRSEEGDLVVQGDEGKREESLHVCFPSSSYPARSGAGRARARRERGGGESGGRAAVVEANGTARGRIPWGLDSRWRPAPTPHTRTRNRHRTAARPPLQSSSCSRHLLPEHAERIKTRKGTEVTSGRVSDPLSPLPQGSKGPGVPSPKAPHGESRLAI